MITDKKPPFDYEEIKKEDKYTLYINKNYLPVMYASGSIMSKKDYNKLPYPYNIEALMNNIVIKENVHNSSNTNINEVKIKDVSNIENIVIDKNDFYVSKDTGKLRLILNEEIKDKILLIRINVSTPQSCTKGDTSITIKEIKNKLTCKEWKYFNNNYTFDYTISEEKPFNHIDLKFTKGHYKIKSINVYSTDYESITHLKDSIDEFKVNKSTKNKISGYINVTNNDYFIIKTPYDKGFKIKLDNTIIKYEKANDAFIGFKINKGFHNIEITYDAPYLKEGKIISLTSFILAIIVLLTDLINNKNSNKIVKQQ